MCEKIPTMTDTTEPSVVSTGTAGQPRDDDRYDRPSRLSQAVAWVVIVAGVVFVVAVIFVSGVWLGWSSSGDDGWHRHGWPDGRMHPGGLTGECPMMGPDGMRGMMSPGQMGSTRPMGPSPSPTIATPSMPRP